MGEFIFLTLTIAAGIGLFCTTCCWLTKTDRIRGKVECDATTGQLVYKASLFEWVSGILVFLLIWGLASYWVLSGNFSNSARMPWG